MNFIDKLEQYLLKTKRLSYAIIKNGDKIKFVVNSTKNKFLENNPETKIEGVKELIKYLKNETIDSPKYQFYKLLFLVEQNSIHAKKILEYEPSSEDIIHLYQKLGYGSARFLVWSLNILKDKSSALTLFEQGHVYHKDVTKSLLRVFVSYLKKHKLSDDELITSIQKYVKNSINFNEPSNDLIEFLTVCINNQEKSQKIIQELTGKEINLSPIYEETDVIQIKVDTFPLMKRHNIKTKEKVRQAFTLFRNLVNSSRNLFNNINPIYYEERNEIHYLILDKDVKILEAFKKTLDTFLTEYGNMLMQSDLIESHFNKNPQEWEKIVFNSQLSVNINVKPNELIIKKKKI